MAPFPAIVAAGFRVRKRLHMFGDFRQLPPINRSRTPLVERWLGRDAFEISGMREAAEQSGSSLKVTLLDIQYRMAEEIARIVSDFGYGGRLQTDLQANRRVRAVTEGPPFPGCAVTLVDTTQLDPACAKEARASSYSRFNALHAALAVSLAESAARTGRSVALITPYRAQARLMNALVKSMKTPEPGIVAATVHRFQGSERDVVMVDLVDAPEATGASNLTGRDPETAFRLLNVALSRARGKLVVMAHGDFVRQRHGVRSPVRRAVSLLMERGHWLRLDAHAWFEQLADAGANGRSGDGLEWFTGWEDAQQELSAELQGVSRVVVAGFPPGFRLSAGLAGALAQTAARGVRTVVWCPVDAARALEASRVVGTILSQPAPRAEIERAIAQICGRCPDCGEVRRPRRSGDGTWVVRCGVPTHRGEGVDHATLERLVAAAELSCPGCGGRAIVKGDERSLFLVYLHDDAACNVTAVPLDEVFGGDR